MRTLIVEDEPVSRILLTHIMEPYGDCDTAVNGLEAVEAFEKAFDANKSYDLILLDIMMPKMNGHEALKKIRHIEKISGLQMEDEVKVIMTTVLDAPGDMVKAYYHGGCTAYLTKPMDREKLVDILIEFGLIDSKNNVNT
ncbi:MAG: response regulator [bacterium]|nr:response regulator [bacterium]